MGTKGQRSTQLSVKVTDSLLDKMENEIDEFHPGMTKTEFINDGIKFYIDYLRNQRIEEAKIREQRNGGQTMDEKEKSTS